MKSTARKSPLSLNVLSVRIARQHAGRGTSDSVDPYTTVSIFPAPINFPAPVK